jgi:SAM-dependent methyltransferase
MGPGSRTADPFGFTCLAAEDALPFADFSFDRVLLVHGLETAENARRLLREVWRVMADDGRLIVVAPNRRGMWAHADSTPFGHGQPYSPGQIGQLLRAAMFSVERRDAALFVPPTRLRIVLNSAPVWERTGRRFARGLAGLTITEAVKDMYAAVPAGAVLDGAAPARRAVIAEAA